MLLGVLSAEHARHDFRTFILQLGELRIPMVSFMEFTILGKKNERFYPVSVSYENKDVISISDI